MPTFFEFLSKICRETYRIFFEISSEKFDEKHRIFSNFRQKIDQKILKFKRKSPYLFKKIISSAVSLFAEIFFCSS